MHYLALCCIVKDEDRYLKEWLAYHALLGVEHFYIYDHSSHFPVKKLLENFADTSRVTVRRIAGERMQLPAYDDCLRSFGASCAWIGFIDCDEFILPMRDNDLRVLLAEFEAYGGLAAPWHLFSASGYEKRPEGLVIQNYTEAFALQESFQIKSFVRPPRTVQCLNPHYFRYEPGYFCVNEDHYPISPGLQCSFSPGRLVRVNHYFLKSREDFAHKIERGCADRKQSAIFHTMERFDNAAGKPTVPDRKILRFLPELEQALNAGKLPPLAPLQPAESSTEELLEAAIALSEAGQSEKALACLCCGRPEHEKTADFWTLRALLASAMGHRQRADIFIRQALALEPSRTAYAHLRTLFVQQGEERLAEGIRTILERYPAYFS